MLISKKWLSEFVEFPSELSDKDIAERLTRSTVEVEGFVRQADVFEHMVVGKIVSCEKHPNADRLRVCQVQIRSLPLAKGELGGGFPLPETVQIVCGGANVVVGMLVAVALPGAKVRWHGQGELIELAETEIRGEKSFGMICASVEIGLVPAEGEGEKDIRDLSALNVVVGTSLAEALGKDDVIFEIENKSLTNRPDLVSHYGIARELSALYRVPLKEYDPLRIRAGKGCDLMVRVEDEGACPRYMGVVIDGVEIGPSPKWLQDRLVAVGIRSINNIVDITNYVMVEGGQSLHAFDADKLGKSLDTTENYGNTEVQKIRKLEIVVRRAKEGEMIKTLDGVDRVLDPSMLMIADEKNPVVIAGIMGGENSGVSDQTKTIFLESANFHPTVVRKTSQKLSLRSEASMRYEKSLDPALSDLVLRRTVQLIHELHPNAKIVSPVVDVYPNPPRSPVIQISPEWLESRMGVSIPEIEVRDILSRLGFTFGIKKWTWQVMVPSWRGTKDISIPEDIVEEVLRIWGYDRIPVSLPSFSCTPPTLDVVVQIARRLRHALAGSCRANEAYTYAYVRPETLTTLGFDLNEHLKLSNPLSDERPYLSRSLIPNLLEAASHNQHTDSVVSLFQIDRVFFGELSGDEDGEGGILPSQPYHVALVYSAQGDEIPFVVTRRMMETALTKIGYSVTFGPVTNSGTWMHPTRSADILVNGKKQGVLAEVVPETASTLGLDHRIAVAELNLSALALVSPDTHVFAPLPQFPDVKRDVAFVVEDRLAYSDLDHALRANSSLLVDVELFDIYRGKGVEAGKKSVAVHLVLRALDRTLLSEEADAEIAKLVHVLQTTFGAIIRS